MKFFGKMHWIMEVVRAQWRSYLLVEPALFFWMFGQVASGNIFTDLVIFRTCRIMLGIDNANCTILHTDSDSPKALELQQLIQPETKNTLMYKTVFDNLIPAIVSLFVGTYSDKNGRKPILLIGYLGSTISWSIMALISSHDINTMFYILAYIPYVISGGFCGIFIGTLSYISDITDNARRPIHMIWFEVVLAVASICGTLACPAMFKKFGYSTVYGVSTVAGLISILYTKLVVPETVPVIERSDLNIQFCVSVAKESYWSVTKMRTGFKRNIVWLCIIIIVIIQILLAGESGILYMFTSAVLGWNLLNFANYSVACLVLVTTWGIIGSKIMNNYLQLSETTILMITCMFMLANRTVLSLTFQEWHMYLAVGFSLFNGMLSPMVRSLLTKSVPAEDVGKIFSMTMFIEILITALVAGPIYQTVYKSFMPPKVYPCPAWIVSAIFILIIMAITTSIHILLKREIPTRVEDESRIS